MKNASRRTRRMQRHHKMGKGSPLNLVSLMDIFTILVFFLLVNSSNAPQLPSQKDLALPKSTAKKMPEETLVLAITAESLLIGGREIVKIDEVKKSATDIIDPLQKELEFQRNNRQLTAPVSTEQNGEPKGETITIMGDENIPYDVMHKILATCQQANYTEIAFAAHQKAKPKS